MVLLGVADESLTYSNTSDTSPRPGGLIVAIPAFNEERTIARVIITSRKFADTVVVCDDGSTDLTGEIARALGVRVLSHARNMGKGAALKTLIEEVKQFGPRVVVTIDADGQHDSAGIPAVAKPIIEGEADVVIGVRSKGGVMPRERIIGNRLLDEATSRKAGTKLEDTQSGFRAYSRRALDTLDFQETGMAIESQTLIDAAKTGLKIVAVPISTTYEGVLPKRSRIAHFSGVFDYVLSRTVADSPLLYMGLPGILAMVAGLVLGIGVVVSFEATRVIQIGTAIVSVALVIVGAILATTGLIIKFVKSSFVS